MRDNRFLCRASAAVVGSTITSTTGLLALADSANAHHPFGGTVPETALAGFLSGMGHPVIGLDHFAFVIALGLIAATMRQGLAAIASFLLAAALGTSIHLQAINLPVPELVIASSVVILGIVIVATQRIQLLPMLAIATGAGLFHGYAYGEAIIGAEMGPLWAYLAGFTVIQAAIAGTSWAIAEITSKQTSSAICLPIKITGGTIAGVGLTLLTQTVMG